MAFSHRVSDIFIKVDTSSSLDPSSTGSAIFLTCAPRGRDMGVAALKDHQICISDNDEPDIGQRRTRHRTTTGPISGNNGPDVGLYIRATI